MLGPLAVLLAAYEARSEANAFDSRTGWRRRSRSSNRTPRSARGAHALRAVARDQAQGLCGLQHALVEAVAAPDGAVALAGDDDRPSTGGGAAT